jgi:hypothetical protein
MKTSLVILTLSTLIICFSLTGCKKDPTKNAKLPPITQEGKNTIGFTIDGEVWVPYYKCSLMGDPCGEIHASYGETGGASPEGIGFSFTRKRGNKMSYLIISSVSNNVSSVGDKTDSIWVNYVDEGSVGNNRSFTGPLSGSKFIITKFDLQNQIIAGEFSFSLIEQNGSGKILTIKDGRFDFKFNACECSR